MLIDPVIVTAVTIRAIQRDAIARGLFMLGRVQHLGQALFVQIAEFESNVTHLYGAVGAYPDQGLLRARHAHFPAAYQPVRN
jgi:hypothetical protein